MRPIAPSPVLAARVRVKEHCDATDQHYSGQLLNRKSEEGAAAKQPQHNAAIASAALCLTSRQAYALPLLDHIHGGFVQLMQENFGRWTRGPISICTRPLN